MNKFTLDELCLFDRCLFPDDFANAMFAYDAFDKDVLIYWITEFRLMQKREKLCVLDIYQNYINDTRFTTALDNLLFDFVYNTHEYYNHINDLCD